MNDTAQHIDKLVFFIQDTFGGMPSGIIFDCDGVLIDSRKSNDTYYSIIFQALGLPPLSNEQKDFCHRSSSMQVFDALVPKCLHAKLPLAKKVSERHHVDELITAMTGAIDFVNFTRKHCKLAIHTNRSGTVGNMLKNLGFENYFFPIMTSVNALPKPSPDGTLQILSTWGFNAHEVLFIGDSLSDIETAEAAKVPFLQFAIDSDAINTCLNFLILLQAFNVIIKDNITIV